MTGQRWYPWVSIGVEPDAGGGARWTPPRRQQGHHAITLTRRWAQLLEAGADVAGGDVLVLDADPDDLSAGGSGLTVVDSSGMPVVVACTCRFVEGTPVADTVSVDPVEVAQAAFDPEGHPGLAALVADASWGADVEAALAPVAAGGRRDAEPRRFDEPLVTQSLRSSSRGCGPAAPVAGGRPPAPRRSWRPSRSRWRSSGPHRSPI